MAKVEPEATEKLRGQAVLEETVVMAGMAETPSQQSLVP